MDPKFVGSTHRFDIILILIISEKLTQCEAGVRPTSLKAVLASGCAQPVKIYSYFPVADFKITPQRTA